MPALKNMNPVQHLVEPVLRTPLHCDLTKLNPLQQHLPQRLLRWSAIQPHHSQINRGGTFKTGMRQQYIDELRLFNFAGLGFKHQPNSSVFAGLIAHHIKHGKQRLFQLHLILTERFFASFNFRIGQLFNLFKHALGADARRQLLHHQLPLATRQLFNLPAGTYFERTTSRAVSRCNFCSSRCDLPATWVIRPCNQCVQLVISQLGGLDQRNTRIGNFTQIVTRNLSCQTHRNAASPIEQCKR